MKVRVHKTVAIMLLAGVTGCASGPFHHRKTPPPPAIQPPPPEMSQTPLYSPEMSDGIAKVPALPATQAPAVLKSPPPPPEKPQKKRKARPPVATPKVTPSVAGGNAAGTPVAAGTGAAASAPTAGEAAGGAPVVPERKAGEMEQAVASEAPAASPIGDLTAGNSEEAARTSRQAEDLIKSTKDGVDGIKRSLSSDEKKTVVEIGTFLKRADQALKNGDVDGAYGLATKAKLLLDELTPK